MPDAVVIGAGIVGLCTAYRLVRAGLSVVVLDRGPVAGGATGAATGIVPRDTGADGAFASLCRAGAVELDTLLAELAEHADGGFDVGHARPGGLQLVVSESERETIRGAFEAETARGVPAEWWTVDELRRAEPAVAAEVLAAVHYPTVRCVDARKLSAVLATAIARAGGAIRTDCGVSAVKPAGARALTVHVESGKRLEAGFVVAATGAWAGAGPADIPPVAVEPVRGQACRLRAAPGLLRHVLMFGERHIVPRADGTVVVGATSEHVGFDCRTTADGVGGILADAIRVVPALAKAGFEAAWAGLRPQSRRRLPFIGPAAGPAGVFVAAGHYKSGLLLGPITGRMIADQVAGGAGAVAGIDPGLFRPDRL
jgi:glycine oxidase